MFVGKASKHFSRRQKQTTFVVIGVLRVNLSIVSILYFRGQTFFKSFSCFFFHNSNSTNISIKAPCSKNDSDRRLIDDVIYAI